MRTRIELFGKLDNEMFVDLNNCFKFMTSSINNRQNCANKKTLIFTTPKKVSLISRVSTDIIATLSVNGAVFFTQESPEFYRYY